MNRSTKSRRQNRRDRASRVDVPVLQPNAMGTGLLLLGCAMAAMLGSGESISAVLRMQALVVGAGLLASIAMDARVSLRNAVRVDVICLMSLYFLTYIEFLFPQPGFDDMALGYDVGKASGMTLLGMGALTIGRHSVGIWDRPMRPQMVPQGEGLKAGHWLGLLYVSAVLGYLHMLLAVNFNPVTMVQEMMEPRFSQSWGRGKFGDWKALITELSLFLNVIPPVYGVIFAKRRKISASGFWLATAVAGLTLFQGYAGGTRNVFATYVAGLIGAYLLVQPKLQLRKTMMSGGIGILLLYVSTQQMLAFRQIGLSNYLKYGKPEIEQEQHRSGFFVDANLLNMAMLIRAFDSRHEPLGLNVPYIALIRPIPRAIWPAKPEGLKIGIEEACGLDGLTLAVTCVGEGYMAARSFGVILVGLFFGGLCGFWNARFRYQSGSYSQLVYAAGFLPAAISMRSLFSFTPALLPIIGLLVITRWLKYHGGGAVEKSKRRAGLRRPEPAIGIARASILSSEVRGSGKE